jgi:mutator protein MutT
VRAESDEPQLDLVLEPGEPAPEWKRPVRSLVAGLLVRDGKVLLCHRGAARWYPNTWDLPGGHVETGEMAAAALRRELAEELGITVARLGRKPVVRMTSDQFDLSVWLITTWSGEPSNRATDEHDAVDWFNVSAMSGMNLSDDRLFSPSPPPRSAGMGAADRMADGTPSRATAALGRTP